MPVIAEVADEVCTDSCARAGCSASTNRPTADSMTILCSAFMVNSNGSEASELHLVHGAGLASVRQHTFEFTLAVVAKKNGSKYKTPLEKAGEHFRSVRLDPRDVRLLGGALSDSTEAGCHVLTERTSTPAAYQTASARIASHYSARTCGSTLARRMLTLPLATVRTIFTGRGSFIRSEDSTSSNSARADWSECVSTIRRG